MSAKKGIPHDEVGPYLEISSSAAGWSLCIGAGVSKPLFPNWDKLTEKLVNKKIEDQEDAEMLSDELLEDQDADTVIQASQDRIGMGDREFSNLLADVIYSRARNKLSQSEFNSFKDALNAHAPNAAEDGSFEKLLEVSERQNPQPTALPVARRIVDVIDSGKSPRSILSFNAETLLFALCNAFILEDWKAAGGSSMDGDSGPRKKIDLVTHSISNRFEDRIPYVMCHGLLPVPGYEGSKPFDPREKLVFSENEYLKLANSSYSWRSSEFLSTCSTTRVLFLGVSLSDSNMRRWLTWVHQNRKEELRSLDTYGGGASTSHLWVQKSPETEEKKRWIESSVAHLGVRLIWVENWGQVGEVFDRLLGM